jgi:ADP-heptose:LPS heptosyltransferase
MRILVTRTDRLGDVILATPVLRMLRTLRPEARISFLVRKSWMPVLAYGPEVELIPYDPDCGVEDLERELSSRKFDVAYVLKDESKVTRAVKKAGIPIRVGPLSSFRSWLSFNEGRFQRRSSCRMHEAEYNLDLITRQSPASDPDHLPRAWIATAPDAKLRALSFLKKHGLTPRGFIVLHPGSSGSSRYVKLPMLHYFVQRVLQKGIPVVVSGGPLESEILEGFKQASPQVRVLGSGEGLELDGMAEVYRMARVVVAHGTGPLHLAAAVETPVLALFPPIFVLSEKRWGPLIEKRKVWVPSVNCPEKYRCRGERCPSFDCMDLFDVESQVRDLEALIS